jgi:hypothetical protein
MLHPKIEITITDIVTGSLLTFTRVAFVEIESTWKALTDTAKITLPRNIRVLNGDINSIVKRGSKVVISLGYEEYQMYNEFTGYVARIDTKVPFSIMCEDEMWQLKQTNFTKAFGKTNLKEIISYIYPGEAKVIDMELPSYRINKVSAAKVLASLKDQYGLVSYFKDGVLNVGFAYDWASQNEAIFHFQRNVPEDGVDLEYKLPEDYKVRVRGVSVQPGNKIIEYTATDANREEYNPTKGKFDGDEITLKQIPNGLTKEQLKRLVDDKIKKYKIGGYRGTLKAFGIPYVRHGDIAHLINQLYPETEGRYYIDKTTIQYGDGIRRVLDIGRKVAI